MVDPPRISLWQGRFATQAHTWNTTIGENMARTSSTFTRGPSRLGTRRALLGGGAALLLALALLTLGFTAHASARTRTTRRSDAARASTGTGTGGKLGVGSSTSPGTHLVPGYLYGLPLATKLGPAAASHKMQIGVEIQGQDPSGEATLDREIYTAGSAEYHHYLTPAQFNRRFGVTPATSAKVRDWLTAGGLSIQTGSGDYYLATGTVAQLDKLLKVSIDDYTYKGEHVIANDAPPSVPNALPIVGIIGLDNVNKMTLDSLHGRTLKHLAAIGRKAHPHNAIAAAKDVGPQAGDEQEFTPQELWGIYDDPGASTLTKSNGTSDPTTLEDSKTTLGQGQTIGIFGEGETSSVVAQLRLFEAAMGFPKVTVRTIHTAGGTDSDYGDNTGAIEWYLDSQSSTGISPDVSELKFYFAQTLYDAQVLQDFKYWADDPNGPREMNASFGECEEGPTNPVTGPLAQQPYGTELGDELEAMGDKFLEQANTEGRTLFSAAGDTGSGCPELVAPVVGAGNGVAPQPAPIVNYPCDSPYAVCVGGTVVSADGTTYPTAAKRDEETSWTDSGGGSSHFIPEPTFQDGVKAVDIPCQTNPEGDPYPADATPTCRGVPDVADLSGNITGDGYFIYIDGEPSSEGGTSLASPLMMGQWARVQAAAAESVQKAGGVGYANPIIYKQAKDADSCDTDGCPGDTTYDRDFFDVTQSEYGTTNGVYPTTAGWDYVSGWGSLNVANFTKDVDGKTTASYAAASPEKPAVKVTTATMTSPQGNATNPLDVSLGNVPSLDLTKATLTTSADGSDIIATLSGPSIGTSPATNSPDGNTFYVAWEFGGKVYYAQAVQSTANTFTYSSGDTGTYGDADTYDYNDNSGTSATGSYDATTHTITITVPAKEVGSPALGDALTVPQAFDQLDSTDLEETTDSADDLTPISKDDGKSVSIGEEVIVGGAKTSVGNFGGKSCTKKTGPVVHAKARFTKKGIVAHGISSNHGCKGHIVSVGVAVAKSVSKNDKKCRFLGKNGKFGKVTSCKPRDFLKAKGTKHWTYVRTVKLSKGPYFLWAHATNSKHETTRNTARKHIFYRLTT